MKQTRMIVAENTPLAQGVYRLRLHGDVSAVTAPGQFVSIKLNGFFLRRPFSVCDWESGGLTVIYKVLGGGTRSMAALPEGAPLDTLTGLGNGFDLSCSGDAPLLTGGGVGAAPLYGLAKRLTAQGKRVTAVLGFNHASERFLADEFSALGARTVLLTADGSAGRRGLVPDGMALAGEYSHLYACGPEAMLRAVYERCRTSGQFSLEERMGCGFGACMGCSCQTKDGHKRVCRDGPVFRKEELTW